MEQVLVPNLEVGTHRKVLQREGKRLWEQELVLEQVGQLQTPEVLQQEEPLLAEVPNRENRPKARQAVDKLLLVEVRALVQEGRTLLEGLQLEDKPLPELVPVLDPVDQKKTMEVLAA
jgi:hypothetical protein